MQHKCHQDAVLKKLTLPLMRIVVLNRIPKVNEFCQSIPAAQCVENTLWLTKTKSLLNSTNFRLILESSKISFCRQM